MKSSLKEMLKIAEQERALDVKELFAQEIDLVKERESFKRLEPYFRKVSYHYPHITETGFAYSSEEFLRETIKREGVEGRIVVKAIPLERAQDGELLKELSSYALMRSLFLDWSCYVKILDVGICRKSGEGFIFLVQEEAKGERVDEVLQSCGKDEKAFLTAQACAKSVGKALAELSSVKLGKKLSCSKAKVEHYKKNLFTCKEYLLKVFPKIDWEGFWSYFLFLVEEVKVEKYSACYWHGDAYQRNIFYDQADQLVTFIDLAEMHLSVDYQGNPIGSPAFDFTVFEARIMSYAFKGFEKEKVLKLKEKFREGYLTIVSELPSRAHRKFEECRHHIVKLYALAGKLDKLGVEPYQMQKALLELPEARYNLSIIKELV